MHIYIDRNYLEYITLVLGTLEVSTAIDCFLLGVVWVLLFLFDIFNMVIPYLLSL
jgi:hypothetical protein